jgi:hypothetical protein
MPLRRRKLVEVSDTREKITKSREREGRLSGRRPAGKDAVAPLLRQGEARVPQRRLTDARGPFQEQRETWPVLVEKVTDPFELELPSQDAFQDESSFR